MPNPPDINQPLFVADDDAYRRRFGELMESAKVTAERELRALDAGDINAAASAAAEFARNTPFALAATAMIQGDRSKAEQLCGGDDPLRRGLMQRIEAAVQTKLAMLEESRQARRSRNLDRRR